MIKLDNFLRPNILGFILKNFYLIPKNGLQMVFKEIFEYDMLS